MNFKINDMKRNTLLLLFGFILAVFGYSCVKEGTEPLGDAGKTLLKFNDGPQKSLFFSPFSEVKEINLFNLRRDPNSGAELSKAVSIIVELDDQIIVDYNTDNETNYEPLPADFFTFILDGGVTRAGNQFTFNFLAGDFAKNVSIQLDGSKWIPDLSKTYAFAFKITNDAGIEHTAGKDTMMTFLSIKNRWDGVYEVSGTMVDVANGTLGHINSFLSSVNNATGVPGPMQFELRTISETKCVVFDNYFFGGNYMPIASGTSYSQYGSFALIIEFDPNTDNIVAVTNFYGQPAGNTRYAELDPSGANLYDPVTKTVKINYNMCQPSVIVTPPHIRTSWIEEWKFLKDRE